MDLLIVLSSANTLELILSKEKKNNKKVKSKLREPLICSGWQAECYSCLQVGKEKMQALGRFSVLAAKGETELAVLLVQQTRFLLHTQKMNLTKTRACR